MAGGVVVSFSARSQRRGRPGFTPVFPVSPHGVVFRKGHLSPNAR